MGSLNWGIRCSLWTLAFSCDHSLLPSCTSLGCFNFYDSVPTWIFSAWSVIVNCKVQMIFLGTFGTTRLRAILNLFLIYSVIRFRHKPSEHPAESERNSSLAFLLVMNVILRRQNEEDLQHIWALVKVETLDMADAPLYVTCCGTLSPLTHVNLIYKTTSNFVIPNRSWNYNCQRITSTPQTSISASQLTKTPLWMQQESSKTGTRTCRVKAYLGCSWIDGG